MFGCDFPDDSNNQVLVACSGSNEDKEKTKHMLSNINGNYKCHITTRSEIGDQLPLDIVRSMIKSCKVLIAVLTKAFIDNNICLCEVAIAANYRRNIILVKFDSVKIPPMFDHLHIIDVTSAPLDIDQVKRSILELDSRETEGCQRTNQLSSDDLIKEYPWYVYNMVYNKLKTEITESQRIHIQEKQIHENRIMNLYNDIAELQNSTKQKDILIQNLQRELEVCKEQLKQRDSAITDIHSNQNSTKSVQRITNETMAVGERLENIEGVVKALCDGLHTIQENLVVQNREPLTVEKTPLPPEIKRLAKKYHNLIGKASIRQFGRLLDLEDDELNHVESFSEHGTAEMFWQTIRIWVSTADSAFVNVNILIKALKESGVDLEGKQMPKSHQDILSKCVSFFINCLCEVDILIPYLMTKGLVCKITTPYILAPKTSDQRILRLLDVLKTKENGLRLFQSSLAESGNDHVAQRINDLLTQSEETQLKVNNKPIAVLRPSPRSSLSTCSDTDLSDTYIKEITLNYRTASRSSSTSSSATISSQTAIVNPKVQTVVPMRSDLLTESKMTKCEKSGSKLKRTTNANLNCIQTCVLF